MHNFAPAHHPSPLILRSARKWALLSGRPDLIDKPVRAIVKYYLCSAHFESECFADEPHCTQLLRRKRPRPYSVPLPTLFAAAEDLGRLTSGAAATNAIPGPAAAQLLTTDDSEPRLESHYLDRLDDIERVIEDDADYQRQLTCNDERPTTTEVAAYCSEPNRLMDAMWLNDEATTPSEPHESPADHRRMCRLCAQASEDPVGLIDLFDGGGSLNEDVVMLMPNMVSLYHVRTILIRKL